MKRRKWLAVLSISLAVTAAAFQIWAVIAGQLGQLASVIGSALAATGAIISGVASVLFDNPLFFTHARKAYTGTFDTDTVPAEHAREEVAGDGTINRMSKPAPWPRKGDKFETEAQEFFQPWDDPSGRAAQITPKQNWETRLPDGRRYLLIKFGVVHVHVIRARAKGCVARANVTITRPNGLSSYAIGQRSAWFGLNWWDEANWSRMKDDVPIRNAIYENPSRGVNRYMQKLEEMVSPVVQQDLPLFYMREGWPDVFLCGSSRPAIIGSPGSGDPVEFDISVCLEAETGDPQIFRYHVSAKWDQFSIEQTWGRIWWGPEGKLTLRERIAVIRRILSLSSEEKVKLAKRLRDGPPPLPPGSRM